MDWLSVLGSTTTVASFVLFLGIVAWAYSSRRNAAFAAAANAPFALPDEVSGAPNADANAALGTERQS